MGAGSGAAGVSAATPVLNEVWQGYGFATPVTVFLVNLGLLAEKWCRSAEIYKAFQNGRGGSTVLGGCSHKNWENWGNWGNWENWESRETGETGELGKQGKLGNWGNCENWENWGNWGNWGTGETGETG